MTKTTLTISSKNYSAWSMRGWLMVKLAGLDFEEIPVSAHNIETSTAVLLLSTSTCVPCLEHNDVKVYDTLSIGEYLHEIAPKAELLPTNPVHRAHCRSICGEMHSGFPAMRASMPMNIKAHFKKTKVWSTAQLDIDRVCFIVRDCLASYKGPYLFGKKPSLADCMIAPMVTGYITYGLALDPVCEAYCQQILSMPEMREWMTAAKAESERIEELEMLPQEQFSFSTYSPAAQQIDAKKSASIF